jgi:hypothetical protein
MRKMATPLKRLSNRDARRLLAELGSEWANPTETETEMLVRKNGGVKIGDVLSSRRWYVVISVGPNIDQSSGYCETREITKPHNPHAQVQQAVVYDYYAIGEDLIRLGATPEESYAITATFHKMRGEQAEFSDEYLAQQLAWYRESCA